MNMYDAIFVRKSVKRFTMEEVEPSVLAGINNFANELPLFMEDAPIASLIVNNLENERAYSKYFSVKAPYYFVVGCKKGVDTYINAGYMIQQIILYMTARGLGTCYLTHINSKPSDPFVMDLPVDPNGDGQIETTQPVIAIAFGHTKDIIYQDSRKLHRLPEREVVLYKTEVSNDLKLMLKAARMAPSHMNTQPWRLVASDNRIHVFCKKSIINKEFNNKHKLIDIGVMSANMMLVADELWIDVQIEKSENISNKYFENNDYMYTISVG
ncbi:MAG: nitroreductase family protein [Clostridiales bacterium]|nr:nitroreductase family protein [Clostridiales bacterium]